MGARLVVKFSNEAMVYLHNGGEYAADVRETLDEFFGELASVNDKRLADAPYLAAKFLVWAAGKGTRGVNPLEFLSVGIVNDAGYGDAVAYVPCDGTTNYSIEKSLDND